MDARRRELSDARDVALDHQLGRQLLHRGIDERPRVTGGEEVRAGVVRGEQLGGVKAARRERAARRAAGVVREVRA